MNEIELENFFAESLLESLGGIEESQETVAEKTGILKQHLSEMKLGKRRCTPEYDLRLSRYFGIEPGFYMSLQLEYDMRKTQRDKKEELEAIQVREAAA